MHESAPLPSLLTTSRGPYARAIADALQRAGFDDMPQGGPRVIAGIADEGPLTGDEALALDMPRTGALIAQLVLLGYAQRTQLGEDRSTPAVVLTPRGKIAARAIGSAVSGVDTRLLQRASPADIAITRRTLAALGDLDA